MFKLLADKRIRKSIKIIAIIFLVFFAYGMYYAREFPDDANDTIEILSQSFGDAKDLQGFGLMAFIFFNNISKSLIALLSGFFFGLGPVIFILSNGFIIGLVLYSARIKLGLAATLAGILPHGIMELPAVFIAAGAGLWLGISLYRKLRFSQPFYPIFKTAMKIYFTIVIPMLLLSALIEAFISPIILNYFR